MVDATVYVSVRLADLDEVLAVVKAAAGVVVGFEAVRDAEVLVLPVAVLGPSVDRLREALRCLHGAARALNTAEQENR
jgi:hypothetical protein